MVFMVLSVQNVDPDVNQRMSVVLDVDGEERSKEQIATEGSSNRY